VSNDFDDSTIFVSLFSICFCESYADELNESGIKQKKKKMNLFQIKYSKICLHWTSLGSECVFRIDRCLVYIGQIIKNVIHMDFIKVPFIKDSTLLRVQLRQASLYQYCIQMSLYVTQMNGCWEKAVLLMSHIYLFIATHFL
jgi:hypothetical protein